MHKGLANLISLVKFQTPQRSNHVPHSTGHSPDANSGHEHPHRDFCHRIIQMLIVCAQI